MCCALVSRSHIEYQYCQLLLFILHCIILGWSFALMKVTMGHIATASPQTWLNAGIKMFFCSNEWPCEKTTNGFNRGWARSSPTGPAVTQQDKLSTLRSRQWFSNACFSVGLTSLPQHHVYLTYLLLSYWNVEQRFVLVEALFMWSVRLTCFWVCLILILTINNVFKMPYITPCQIMFRVVE